MNETVPAESPVTVPELVTDATSELLLTQVPPVEGDRVVVPFTHIFAPPVTTGNGYTVIFPVVLLHPEEDVKVKFAFPGANAVTMPAFVTEAVAGLLLDQVPPVSGDNVVVPPMQTKEVPLIATSGDSLTVTLVSADVAEQPVPLVTLTE